MTLKRFASLFLMSLMLSGCNKPVPTASCTSPDTQSVIDSILKEQALKLTTEKRYDQYDGSFDLGANNIRASLAKVQIAVENIKMIQQEPDNSKSLCSGFLKVTLPAAMLADANQAKNVQHETTIPEYAKQFSIENNGNVFAKNVEYSVKPTGEGKAPQVEIESAVWAHLLDEITTAVLLKPTLDMRETFTVQQNDSPEQDDRNSQPEIEQAENAVDKNKVLQQKQGLARLNQELLEAEQAEQELLKEKAAAQSLPPTTIKQIPPSFNCAKAIKATEITICTNAELAALDVENMKRYKDAKDIDAVATREIWKASIKSKYACGTNVDCIKMVYKKSILNYSCLSADNDSDCGVDAPQDSEGSNAPQ